MWGRWLRSWLAVLAVLILSGCGSGLLMSSDPAVCEPPAPDPPVSVVDGVYVLPDDGRDPVLDEIDRAACTIDIGIYLLSDDTTIDALLRAETRGVRVRIIYEATPFGGGVGIVETTEALADSGIELRTGPDRFRFMHAKYLVIDRQVAIVTNQNFTYSAFESNREVGVVTTNPRDVATIATIFEADWHGTVPPIVSGRLIVSPQNARPALMDQIGSAETTIRLYAEVIRDDVVVDALSSAAQRGVTVRVLVNTPEGELDESVYATLTSNGVDIHTAGHLYIHAKALVIDDRSVVIGSHNPTATSLEENREISLVLDGDVAVARASAVFDQDWTRSTPYGGVESNFENRWIRYLT